MSELVDATFSRMNLCFSNILNQLLILLRLKHINDNTYMSGGMKRENLQHNFIHSKCHMECAGFELECKRSVQCSF